MDDTKKQQTQQPTQENTIVDFLRPQSGGTAVTNQQNTQNQSQVSTPPPTTPQSETTPHKELEPLPSLSITPPEWMVPVEQQVELEPEVEAVGVEAVPLVPQVTLQEKSAGINLAKETTQVEQVSSTQIPFPMSQAQALQITKGSLLTKDTSNPIIWLALLILRQFQILEKQKK